MTRDEDPVLRVIASADDVDDVDHVGESAVHDPGRALRLATTVRGVLDELRGTEPGDAVRDRLARLHDRTVAQVGELVSDELRAELGELALTDARAVSAPELRVVLAEMVGWLEGVFHGISAELVDGEDAPEVPEPPSRSGHYL